MTNFRQKKEEIKQRMIGPGGNYNYYPNHVVNRANLNHSLAAPPVNNENLVFNNSNYNTRDYSNPRERDTR